MKSLRDKFLRFEEGRQKENRKNIGLSGNAEVVSDFDQLMDDIILGKEDFEEEVRNQPSEHTNRDAMMKRFGLEICTVALRRRRFLDEVGVEAGAVHDGSEYF